MKIYSTRMIKYYRSPLRLKIGTSIIDSYLNLVGTRMRRGHNKFKFSSIIEPNGTDTEYTRSKAGLGISMWCNF